MSLRKIIFKRFFEERSNSVAEKTCMGEFLGTTGQSLGGHGTGGPGGEAAPAVGELKNIDKNIKKF